MEKLEIALLKRIETRCKELKFWSGLLNKYPITCKEFADSDFWNIPTDLTTMIMEFLDRKYYKVVIDPMLEQWLFEYKEKEAIEVAFGILEERTKNKTGETKCTSQIG